MAADGNIGLDPLLDCMQPQLFQAPDLRLGKGCVNEILEGCSPEQRERLAQYFPGGLGIAGLTRRSGLVEQGLEALEVELAGLNAQPVTGRLSHQSGAVSIVREHAAKAREVRLQGWACARRRRRSPKPVDQPVPGDDLVAAQQEHGERRSLLRAAERQDAPLIEDLQRAK